MSGAAADGIDDRDVPKQDLLEAAFNGDVEKIDSLIRENKVHIDSADDDHVTALHIAAAMGNNKLVVRLLDHGANINAVNQLGMTAFHYAAREGQLAVIDSLLQRGASKHLKTYLGVTALTLACAGGHADVVWRLIRLPQENAICESKKRSLAPTPLMVATCSKSPLICGYLADNGFLIDDTLDVLRGISAMAVAIICTPGLYMVRTLLDRGASATKRSLMVGNKSRLSPEEIAERFHRKDVLKFFNETRSCRSRTDADSDLRKEVKNDMIIERELTAPPQNGCTLLMYATTVRSINSAKHLVLHRDSDVNMRDNMHITALQIASLLRVDDIIPLLLQRNADVTVINKFGSTAYDLFLMSSDSVEPGHLRSQLHCYRPAEMKLNLSSSSSNLYKALATKNLLNKVSSQILMNPAKFDTIEPKHWLEAKVKYQPGKMRNTYKFVSVDDILKSARIAKRPETDEFDNETEATRDYMEECQSFSAMCFTDFYGERDKAHNTDYYDVAQYNAKKSAYPRKDTAPKTGGFPYIVKPVIRPRRNSIERTNYKSTRTITAMDASPNSVRGTPRSIKKIRDTGSAGPTEVFSAKVSRVTASASAQNVPTVSVARPRHMVVPITDEMIWSHFVRRDKIHLMNALKREEIDRHSFFLLKQSHLREMNIYSTENLATIEEIQQAVLNGTM